MNKVLVIASGFPPQGGGGVTRIHSFVKYLPRYNWKPIVLTLNEEFSYFHAVDYSLLEEYDLNVEIYRTGSFEPSRIMGRSFRNELTGFSRNTKSFASRLKKIFKYFYELLLIPDEKILWLIPAVIKAWKLIKGKKIGIVFLTSPPHSVTLIGYVLKKITKIPLVWDIRDDWIGNLYFESGHWHRSKIETFLESKIASIADQIVVVTPESRDLIIHKYPNSRGKIQIIPNGFDPDNFRTTIDSQPINRKVCKFIYSGSLTRRRNLTSFFEVIVEMKRRGDLKKELLIDFVGSVHQEQMDKISTLGLGDIVSVHGHVSHRESIHHLVDSDVCLLISTPEEGSCTVIPSKIYEYIGAKKFIFALAEEDSAVANLMKDQDFGILVSPSDTKAIRDGLSNTLASFRDGTLKANTSEDFRNHFNRLLQTEELSLLFNRILVKQ